jgi:hypothetical protein
MSERKLFVDPLFPEMGTMNAMFKKLADQMGVSEPVDVIKGINDDNWVVAKNELKWKRDKDEILISMISRGWDKETWLRYCEVKPIINAANSDLSYIISDFGYEDIEKVEVVVVGGDVDGGKRGFGKPRPEVAFLLRDMFTNHEIERMGFQSIWVMHDPIIDTLGRERYLGVHCAYRNTITGVSLSNDLILGPAGFAYVVNRDQETKSKILDHIATVPVEGADHFVASEHFKVGETDGVKISEIGSNFASDFLGKVEKNIPQSDLRIYRLKKDFRDAGIITELGGDGIVETTLAHLWNLLKKQGHGQDGQLQTNGKNNVFFIPDMGGVLWHVSASWFNPAHQWCIDSRSTESPCLLKAGSQVISG